MTDAQAAAYEADGFEVALHLVTGSGCQDFTPASLENDLTTQLARVRGRVAERQEPGHQPHPLHRLERLGDRGEAREGARDPLRHELLLQRPSGLADEARAAHRLRLPAALRRPRRLAHRHLPGDDAGHGRVRDADGAAGGHPARQRARPEGLVRRRHRAQPHRPRRSRQRERHRGLGAGPRGAGGVLGPDARLARRAQRLLVQGRGIQRRARSPSRSSRTRRPAGSRRCCRPSRPPDRCPA